MLFYQNRCYSVIQSRHAVIIERCQDLLLELGLQHGQLGQLGHRHTLDDIRARPAAELTIGHLLSCWASMLAGDKSDRSCLEQLLPRLLGRDEEDMLGPLGRALIATHCYHVQHTPQKHLACRQATESAPLSVALFHVGLGRNAKHFLMLRPTKQLPDDMLITRRTTS